METYTVLLIEGINEVGITYLREHGARVVIPPSTDRPTLFRLVEDADGLIARAVGQIDADMM
ncbi:MAG: hypothetical protein HY709_09500, partial [Candidatus Latescibacteria bacterium]|nr:hypothetical protein [Candidatus Latescibacterota bacterium]